MGMLKFIAPATDARRGARKEAEAFAARVVPGRIYYSILDCNWPWGRGRLLYEWTFKKPSFWSGGQPMCGHLTAGGVWLSYGPIHEKRPAGILTFEEYRNRAQFPPDAGDALRMAEQAMREAVGAR